MSEEAQERDPVEVLDAALSDLGDVGPKITSIIGEVVSMQIKLDAKLLELRALGLTAGKLSSVIAEALTGGND